MFHLFSPLHPPAVSSEGPTMPGPVEEPEPVCVARGWRCLEERWPGSQRRISKSQTHHLQLLPPRSSRHQPQLWEHRGSRIPKQQQHKWGKRVEGVVFKWVCEFVHIMLLLCSDSAECLKVHTYYIDSINCVSPVIYSHLFITVTLNLPLMCVQI